MPKDPQIGVLIVGSGATGANGVVAGIHSLLTGSRRGRRGRRRPVR
jgi:hypothetical protein